MKIAFDIGGVLSKYPKELKPLLRMLFHEGKKYGIEVHVISDMHPIASILAMLLCNDISVPIPNVHSADYKAHGERCKAVLCEQLGINILIDDFPGYLADGSRLRLLVMPDTSRPYYHDDWRTDGSEGDFGRRRKPTEASDND